jgi:hypothetical protein
MAERAKKTKNPARAIPTASQAMRTQNTCQPTRFAKSGSRPRRLRSERHMEVARAGTMTFASTGARGPTSRTSRRNYSQSSLRHTLLALTNSLLQYMLTCIVEPPEDVLTGLEHG